MRADYLTMILLVALGFGQILGCDTDDDTSRVELQFCHALRKNGETLTLTVKASQKGVKHTFKADTECCTPCASFEGGEPTNFVLSDDVGEIYRTTATMEKETDLILLADVLEGDTSPKLALSADLTQQGLECETYTPPPWTRCGSVN